MRFKEPLAKVALCLAGVPVLLILALFGYSSLARIHLGHWPSYNNPDPTRLGWWYLHDPLTMGFITFPFWSLVAVGLAIYGRRRSKHFPIWMILVTALVSAMILIVFARIDPGGFVNWFWD
jgi:hypothetical protein